MRSRRRIALTAVALAAWACGTPREIRDLEAAPGPDAAATCTRCHGDASRSPSSIAAAPPADAHGQTTSSAVGAHLAHLTGGAARAALACTDCHAVPVDDAHAARPLDLTWGSLARAGGVTPSWTAATLTCSNYCHGASLSGGRDTTPAWDGGPAAAACGTCHGLPPGGGHPDAPGSGTARCRTCHAATVLADGSIDVAGGKHVNGAVERSGTPDEPACGTCHGLPPGGGHPDAPGSGTARCRACHPATVLADGTIDLAGGKHMNGSVETGGSLGCSSCHGGAGSHAPPADTTGGTSGVRVGAHRAHVAGKTFSDGLGGSSSCPECHGAAPTSTGHADGVVQIGWGSAARATGGAAINGDGANPTTLTPGAAATCTNSCHAVKDWKGVSSGGTRSRWAWTDPSPACGACHGSVLGPRPGTGRHLTHASEDCSACHGASYHAWGTVAKATHVNGAVEVSLPGWSRAGNGAAGRCSNVSCHRGESPSWWGGGGDDD